jgi:hypothetical protein
MEKFLAVEKEAAANTIMVNCSLKGDMCNVKIVLSEASAAKE